MTPGADPDFGGALVNRVLVGVDGSPQSALALSWACSFADHFGSKIVAVHAVGLLAHLGPDHVVPAGTHRGELEKAFAVWTAPAHEHCDSVATELVDGEASMVILDAGRRHDVDIVIVGARGMGKAPAQLLGSTAHRVAQLCDRPVLLVTERDPKPRRNDG